MKTLIWAIGFLGAALPALAQESTVFVVNGSSNSVTVRTPSGGDVATLNGTSGHPFNNPFDIVVVPSRNLAVVSNNTGGTLTLFDTFPPFAFRQTVVAGAGAAVNLRGLAVSGDERWVYVAGQTSGGSVNPAVFRLDLADPSGAPVAGSLALPSAIAEDVVIIDASLVGGSGGAGPGRVYVSIPGSGLLGIVQVDPPGATSQVTVNTNTPVAVNSPTQISLSPDRSFFFVACTTDAVTQHIIRAVPTPAGLTVTYPMIRPGPFTKGFGNQIVDVAFRSNGHAFVVANEAFGSHFTIEIDSQGNNLNTLNEPPPFAPGRIRYDENPSRLYYGRTDITQGYGELDPDVPPAFTYVTPGAAGPRAFAFTLPFNPPLISDVWPTGLVSAPGEVIEIRGSNFAPGATVTLTNSSSGFAPALTVLGTPTSSVIQISGNAIPVGLYDVRVTNPDTQAFTLASYFLSINPAGLVTTAVDLDVPSRFEGYTMYSVPQYFTAGDLMAAVQAAFGGYSPANVRVFLQQGSGYQELNQAPANRDLSHSSFWMLSRFGGTVTLSRPHVGASLEGVGEDAKVQILLPGWNLVSQPTFNPGVGGSQDMNGVAVWTDGALNTPIQPLVTSLIDTAIAGYTSFPHELVNGAYVALTSIDPMIAGRGYWIRNNTGGPLYFRYLTSDATAKAIAPKSAPRAGSVEPPPAPPGDGLAEETGTTGCGLPGLELFALLGVLAFRGRRR